MVPPNFLSETPTTAIFSVPAIVFTISSTPHVSFTVKIIDMITKSKPNDSLPGGSSRFTRDE
jgi:hypothetical protein